MEQYLTDSITRPHEYERLLNGVLLPGYKKTLTNSSDVQVTPSISPTIEEAIQ